MLIAKPTSRPLSIKPGCRVLDYTRWDARNVLVRASEVAETGARVFRKFLPVSLQRWHYRIYGMRNWFTVYALEPGLAVTIPSHHAWHAETLSAGNDSKRPAP